MDAFRTFFYSLKRSLFDPTYRHDIVGSRFSFSFKFLWFLIFIFVFVKSLGLAFGYFKLRPGITPQVNRFLGYAYDFYPSELELRIRDGKLSTNVEEPYYFELDKSIDNPEEKHFLVIDTRGTVDNYHDYDTYVLATENAVVYPSKSESGNISETSVFYFRDIKEDVTVDKALYDKYLRMAEPYAAKAVYFIDWFVAVGLICFLVFGSFFWMLWVLFGLLFLTAIAFVINAVFKKGYGYKSLYRIGMHAVAWPIFITELLSVSGIRFPGAYLLIYLAAMGFMLSDGRGVAGPATKPRTRKK